MSSVFVTIVTIRIKKQGFGSIDKSFRLFSLPMLGKWAAKKLSSNPLSRFEPESKLELCVLKQLWQIHWRDSNLRHKDVCKPEAELEIRPIFITRGLGFNPFIVLQITYHHKRVSALAKIITNGMKR